MNLRPLAVVFSAALVATAAPGFAQARDQARDGGHRGGPHYSGGHGGGGHYNGGHGHNRGHSRGYGGFGVALGLGLLGAAIAAPYVAPRHYGPAYAPAYPAYAPAYPAYAPTYPAYPAYAPAPYGYGAYGGYQNYPAPGYGYDYGYGYGHPAGPGY